MKEQRWRGRNAVRFKRFAHKSYAVFNSLHRVVNHGVVACCVLTFATPHTAQGHNQLDSIHVEELQEVEVTASQSSLMENEAAKIVTIIERADILAAPAHSLQDLLEYSIGVDVRQRGELGIQSDISVRGGTFDQITILLNGANITNPQTGHFNFDLPISLNDIKRIEILEGNAARIYGTTAFTGAINIVTVSDTTKSGAQVDLSAGQHDLYNAEAKATLKKGSFAHQLSGGYHSSGGYTTNTAFDAKNLFWQTTYKSECSDMHFQLAYSDKAFDANTFYSAKYSNQYEQVRSLYSALTGNIYGVINLSPTVYCNRHYDRFELIHGNDNYNYHQTDVYGINLNAYFYSLLGKTTMGTEIKNESVYSNNLGKEMDAPICVPFESDKYYTKSDNRTNISLFVEHHFVWNDFQFSLGVTALRNTALDEKIHVYPGVDISYFLTDAMNVYTSWNTAMRMPTFTDLYYKSATNGGNPYLKSEKSQTFEVGWKYRTPLLQMHLLSYYRMGRDMIDWLREHPDSIWKSVNHTEVNTLGLEVSGKLFFRKINSASFFNTLQLGYAYISQDKEAGNYESQYALDYLKHKFTVALNHRVWKCLTANWNFRYQEREGTFAQINGNETRVRSYPAYGLLDFRLDYMLPHWLIYAEVNNLFNVSYYDLGNIEQPRLWAKVGVKYAIQWP